MMPSKNTYADKPTPKEEPLRAPHNEQKLYSPAPISAADFKHHVLQWIDKFGLYDWRCIFTVEKDAGDRIATVQVNPGSRVATFICYTTSESVMPVERIALHEVLHLLLADTLAEAVKHEDYYHDDIARLEHAAMERLMRVILGPAEG